MRFEEQVAIVTGGGTGIGQEVARALVREGGRVVLAGLPGGGRTPPAVVARAPPG